VKCPQERSPRETTRSPRVATRHFAMRTCPLGRPPFVSHTTRRHDEEETMKYMLLIHQATRQLRGTLRRGDACRRTSSRRSSPHTERSTRPQASPPASRWRLPRPRPRCACRSGKTLTTDGPFGAVKEALGGYPVLRGGRSRRRNRARVAHSGREHGRCGGGATGREVLEVRAARAGLPGGVGPRPRHRRRALATRRHVR
jgi:hypothetical protein